MSSGRSEQPLETHYIARIERRVPPLSDTRSAGSGLKESLEHQACPPDALCSGKAPRYSSFRQRSNQAEHRDTAAPFSALLRRSTEIQQLKYSGAEPFGPRVNASL